MDIKSLAREVLYMDLYFPWLKGIDHRSRFQGQVNFGVWLKNSFFTLELTIQLPKSVFKVENSTFENFLCAFPGDVI